MKTSFLRLLELYAEQDVAKNETETQDLAAFTNRVTRAFDSPVGENKPLTDSKPVVADANGAPNGAKNGTETRDVAPFTNRVAGSFDSPIKNGKPLADSKPAVAYSTVNPSRNQSKTTTPNYVPWLVTSVAVVAALGAGIFIINYFSQGRGTITTIVDDDSGNESTVPPVVENDSKDEPNIPKIVDDDTKKEPRIPQVVDDDSKNEPTIPHVVDDDSKNEPSNPTIVDDGSNDDPITLTSSLSLKDRPVDWDFIRKSAAASNATPNEQVDSIKVASVEKIRTAIDKYRSDGKTDEWILNELDKAFGPAVDNTEPLQEVIVENMQSNRADETKPAVANLYTLKNGLRRDHGTGFVVQSPDSDKLYVVTCAHVARDFENCYAAFPGGIVKCKRTAIRHDFDLARLEPFGGDKDFKAVKATPLKLLKDAKSTLKSGVNILAVGYPFGLLTPAYSSTGFLTTYASLVESQGVSSRSNLAPALQLVQHQFDSPAGSSGSPVVDIENGKVVGVHLGHLYDKEQLGFFIHGQHVSDFLSGNLPKTSIATTEDEGAITRTGASTKFLSNHLNFGPFAADLGFDHLGYVAGSEGTDFATLNNPFFNFSLRVPKGTRVSSKAGIGKHRSVAFNQDPWVVLNASPYVEEAGEYAGVAISAAFAKRYELQIANDEKFRKLGMNPEKQLLYYGVGIHIGLLGMSAERKLSEISFERMKGTDTHRLVVFSKGSKDSDTRTFIAIVRDGVAVVTSYESPTKITALPLKNTPKWYRQHLAIGYSVQFAKPKN